MWGFLRTPGGVLKNPCGMCSIEPFWVPLGAPSPRPLRPLILSLAACQVIRDTNYRASDPGMNVTEEDKADWQKSAEALIGMCKAAEKELGQACPLKKRLNRSAAFAWCKGLDWQLQTMVGKGLSRYAQQDGDVRRVEQRPFLSVCLDKGSDGWCATWFLVNECKLRMMPFWDPFHGPWNDVNTAMDECGLKSSMLLSTIAHNLEYGPFDGQAFHRKMCETAEELKSLMNVNDPLLQYLWPKICAEMGYEESQFEDKLQFLENLPTHEFLRVKGPRVCSSRWGTWCEADSFRAPYHHARLLVLLGMGLLEGWIKKDGYGQAVLEQMHEKAAAAATASSKDGRQSTSQARKDVSKIRDRCHNSCHVSAVVLMDTKIYNDCGMLAFVSKRVRLYHKVLAKELKCPESSVKFYASAAAVDSLMMTSISELFHPWDSMDELQRCGLTVLADAMELQRLTEDSPQMLHEQAVMKKIWTFTITAACKLLKGHLAHALSYPGRFAMALHPDEAVRVRFMDEMQQDWQAWTAISRPSSVGWEKARNRSPYHWLVTKETFQLAEQQQWKLTSPLKKHIDRMFRHFGQTLVIENMFQKVTDHVNRDNGNKVLSSASLWRRPCKEKILSKLYKYEEVAEETAPAQSMKDCQSLPDSVFHARGKTTSMKLGPPKSSALRMLAAASSTSVPCEHAFSTTALAEPRKSGRFVALLVHAFSIHASVMQPCSNCVFAWLLC